jgi:hypothetical protein
VSARYVLHLVAAHPSHGDTHQDPVDSRELGTYDTETAAYEAGLAYLRDHPEAWLQTQDSDERSPGRDVEVQS